VSHETKENHASSRLPSSDVIGLDGKWIGWGRHPFRSTNHPFRST
jgi:hypothetical protein